MERQQALERKNEKRQQSLRTGRNAKRKEGSQLFEEEAFVAAIGHGVDLPIGSNQYGSHLTGVEGLHVL